MHADGPAMTAVLDRLCAGPTAADASFGLVPHSCMKSASASLCPATVASVAGGASSAGAAPFAAALVGGAAFTLLPLAIYPAIVS